MKVLAVIVPFLTTLLIGCAAPTRQDISEPAPVDYVAQIKSASRSVFVDPDSLMDTEISEPFPVTTVFNGLTPFPHSGWAVCIITNGKNRMGGYTGREPMLFLFKGGRIDQTLGGPQLGPQVAQHCSRGVYRTIEL